jgi:hypothetical protein
MQRIVGGNFTANWTPTEKYKNGVQAVEKTG